MITTLLLAIASQLPPAISVTPPTWTDAKEPQLAIDGGAHPFVAFGRGNEVFVASSGDKGKSFSMPVSVSKIGGLALGMRRGPRITAAKGLLTVSAIYASRGSDGDLFAFTSTDSGKTWGAGVRVNSVVGSAREGLHAMASSPHGLIAAVWLDLRSRGTQLYVATSRDGGKTWPDNRLVYASPSGTICECCHPSVTFDANGVMHVMFRNALNGSRDMYLTKSADGGKTFSPASKLGTKTWKLDACPMDGGMLAATKAGIVETAWRRHESVYKSPATGVETIVSAGSQPWIAAGAHGFYRVWMNGGGIMASVPGRDGFRVAEEGNDPVVCASPDGKIVLAAWTHNGIRLSRLSE